MAKHTKRIVFFNIICLMSYGLFVSTIDRKRINYTLAERAVFVSAITNFIGIFLIIKNIK